MAVLFVVADYSGDSLLADQATAAVSDAFVGRVGVAMAHTALTIQGEDPATSGHTPRAQLAHAVLNNPGVYRAAIAWAVVADGSTGPTASDLSILGRVATVWNAVAGVGG
jgi:hypothetical protein